MARKQVNLVLSEANAETLAGLADYAAESLSRTMRNLVVDGINKRLTSGDKPLSARWLWTFGGAWPDIFKTVKKWLDARAAEAGKEGPMGARHRFEAIPPQSDFAAGEGRQVYALLADDESLDERGWPVKVDRT